MGKAPTTLEDVVAAIERLTKAFERFSAYAAPRNPVTGTAYDHEHIWGEPDTAGYRRCFCGAGR